MVSYPRLSATQQRNLPALIEATPLPALFEESTHQLWRCKTVDGDMMLKVCNHRSVEQSTFWQGMQSLFGLNLPQQLGQFRRVYDDIAALSPLSIPEMVAAGSATRDAAPAFILSRMLAGKMVAVVSDAMVRDLARHITQIHQTQQLIWGAYITADFSASAWPQRLTRTLAELSEQQAIPNSLLQAAIQQASEITAQQFVPLIPDLRWDQFLENDGTLSALVDLDAFVYAPRELELVLLEYLLEPEHAALFKQVYQQCHLMPDLSSVRLAYRLLLFQMNVLGESDLEAWMARIAYW